jgi:hypothetical protein
MKKWTDLELKIAIDLHKTGKHFKQIGNELNRTERSIKEKLKFFNLHSNKENKYENVICENCGNIFRARLKEERKYCSQSCAASINNIKFPKKIKFIFIDRPNNKKIKISTQKYCLNCGKKARKKYCSSNCQHEYQQKEIIKKIENGDTTLNFRHYKKYLIQKYGNKCMKCGWNEINPISGLIPIQLEHKDGNSENHNLNNLELLCPNCHSLTPTYMGLNKGNGRYKRRERYRNHQSS